MADQNEVAFFKNYYNILKAQPVVYGNDYHQPPENSLKKVPILPVSLPDPPEPVASTSTAKPISVLIKSSKPAHTFTIPSFPPTSSIADLKTHLSSTQNNAPPPEAQRLLLKGKALVDGKLLMEYNVKDGDTINLMIKPGFVWDPSTPTTTSPVQQPDLDVKIPNIELVKPSSHRRTPSIVLSPSPSNSVPSSPNAKVMDINLTLDPSDIPSASASAPLSTYHLKLATPEFWSDLRTFIKGQGFATESDENRAFEDFFLGAKGTLTVSEIAKVRDQLEVKGMAGT